MSLLEVLIGMGVLAIISAGILASLIQSRRLTEGSIYQNTAVAVAQGYIEQLKNMEFDQLDLNPIPTLLDQGSPDSLSVSPLPISTSTQVVNRRYIDLNNTPDNPNDDMPMDIVVYIKDLSNPTAKVGECKLITLIYTWEFADSNGAKRRYTNTITSIRSRVPTF